VLTLPIDVVPPLQFSGHETFPLRQLWLRKAFDVLSSSEESVSRSVFADEDAIARFGVGKNMVAAIKHWSLATEFMEETPAGTYRPTALASSIFDEPGFDPYSEHVTTPWLIHWKLAGVAPRSLVIELPGWTKRTASLSDRAKMVRQLLLKANDPHKVLFVDLLQAMGGAPDFSAALVQTILELSGAFNRVLAEVEARLFQALRHDFDLNVLHERARVVAGISGDFRLDAFATRLGTYTVSARTG